MGGSDADQEKKWVWDSGDGRKRNITLQIPWRGIEPNGEEKENCMIRDFYEDGGFGDLPCEGSAYYLCQSTENGKPVLPVSSLFEKNSRKFR